MRGTWRPLLEGELADEAWKAVLAVAAALRTPGGGGESAAETGRSEAAGSAGLAGGSAGLALFFSYLAEARSDEGHADVAMSYLDQAIDMLASMPMRPGLFSGFTGVGWTVDHLDGRLLDPGEGDEAANLELDESLIALLRRQTWSGDYDLAAGLAGFGVYALEGMARPTARECLELLVAQLEELAQERAEGVSWFTPPRRVPESQRELAPKGYYNLGMAHGVPAVVAVLGAIFAAGLMQDRSSRLLEKAVAWLLAQELEADAGSCFPSWLTEGVEPQPSRLAWCYGDPGVAAALLLAARCAAREDWEREALRVAHRAAERPVETSWIRDAGLCHGAAGLGHLFNRLYQATGEEKMADTARFWFRRALEMRRTGEGIGGFLAWAPERDGELEWIAEKGFLTGAAGIALALLGAVSPIEPEWDRVLLSSIPPRAP